MTQLIPPQILHHGAVNGVTGSCHEYLLSLNSAKAGLLIDCGLFQGDETGSGNANALAVEFDINHIQALLVTHVHIDHVGRIPYLLAAGFKGSIICSQASAHLLPLVIEDALKVGFTRDQVLIRRFLKQLKQQIIAVDYGKWFELPMFIEQTIKVKFKPAGHILGSAYVEIETRCNHQKHKTVFSGDLGAPYTPLLPAPQSPYSADVVVIESTYGDKCHDSRKSRTQRLENALLKALQDNGTVIIPAFSIGRTQELLYELEALIYKNKQQVIHQKLAWKNLQIIVDSPLAAEFTVQYQQLKSHWDNEAKNREAKGRHPLDFEQLYTVNTHDEHIRTVNYLASTQQPAIVIAASGMCSGGRVVNYLSAMLPYERHNILFVGYQARGTLGRDIQTYGPRGGYVFIDGEKVLINAGVETLSGYSAHADQKDLVNFVKRMRVKPKEIIIVHGDNDAKLQLQQCYQKLGLSARIGELFDSQMVKL